jgi:hypothetical protein
VHITHAPQQGPEARDDGVAGAEPDDVEEQRHVGEVREEHGPEEGRGVGPEEPRGDEEHQVPRHLEMSPVGCQDEAEGAAVDQVVEEDEVVAEEIAPSQGEVDEERGGDRREEQQDVRAAPDAGPLADARHCGVEDRHRARHVWRNLAQARATAQRAHIRRAASPTYLS